MSSLAYALAAGNTVIVKSSELSPRTYFLLIDAFRRAGFPPGVVNLLTHAPDKGPLVIPALIQNQAIRKISFTGSSATGRVVAKLAGEALKPVVLELGGKAPAIVLEDATLNDAARGILQGAYGHGGQICMATERVIVLRSIEEPFVEALKEAHAEQSRDNAHSQPLISQLAVRQVKALVDDAIKNGASIVSGPADFADEEGRVFGPTILRSVNKTSALYYKESFGPVISLFVVDTVDEAVRLANDTEYGLAASVWSKNIGNALRVAKRIHSG
jgi:acyl-CoA reductase-like NAD-dependent aldehyde dehydrogenase